jgi:hypothetical protein
MDGAGGFLGGIADTVKAPFEKMAAKASKSLSDKEALALVERRYEDNKYNGYLSQWTMNLAFFVGQQWGLWDNESQRVIVPNAPSYRVRMTDNQIQPLVRREVAKLTKAELLWQVFGATGEEKDVNAARMCNKLLDAIWRSLEMSNKRTKLVQWCALCGTSLLKTWFDVDKGPSVFTGTTYQPIGDINCEVVSPFEFITNSNFEDIASAWWCMHVTRQDVERINEVWGVKVSADSTDETRNMYETKIYNDSMDQGGQRDKGDMVTIKEYWQRPTKKDPKGKLVIVAGDKVLFNGENPTPKGDLPFADFRHIPVPGRFWGMSAVEAAIPHQKYLNATLSQIQEIQKRTANPVLMLPMGCGVKDVTSRPGQVMHYLPINGMTPQWQRPATMPAYVLQMPQMTQGSMDNIFGQHEVSRGQIPSGVRSGVGIRYLQDADDTMLGPTARSMAAGFARLGKLWLMIAAQDYEADRKVRYVGRNNVVEVLDFDASNISGSEDVVVIPASVLPESKPARQEFLTQLFQLGAFKDPKTGENDTQRFMQMLELGSFEELFDEVAADMNSAELENRSMSKGAYALIHSWDNHGTHIWKHNNFRKTIEFMGVKPEVQVAFERHINMHRAALTGEGMVWAPDGSVDEQAFAMKVQQDAMANQPQGPPGMPGMGGPLSMPPLGPEGMGPNVPNQPQAPPGTYSQGPPQAPQGPPQQAPPTQGPPANGGPSAMPQGPQAGPPQR